MKFKSFDENFKTPLLLTYVGLVTLEEIDSVEDVRIASTRGESVMLLSSTKYDNQPHEASRSK